MTDDSDPLDIRPKTGSQNIKALGYKLLRNGYSPIPIAPGEKYPSVKDWQEPTTKADIDDWVSNGRAKHGVGINTDNTPAVDIDVLDYAMQMHMRRFVVKHVGPAPVRIGNAPKCLMLYRTDAPFSKITSKKYRDPEGDPAQIEVLGVGQQCVIYGIHPHTNRPYHWHDGIDDDFDYESNDSSRFDQEGKGYSHHTIVPARQLDPIHCPARHLGKITEAKARAVVAEFERRVEELGWPIWEEGAAPLANGHDTASGKPTQTLSASPDEDPFDIPNAPVAGLTAEQVRDYVMTIPNNDASEQKWWDMLAAIHHQSGGEEWGREIAREWSGQSGKHNGRFDYRWNHVNAGYNGKLRTFASVIWEANGIRALKFAYNPKRWGQVDIEPLDFLLGELMHTTSRVMIAGPTGIGKTMFTMDLAFAMAGGIDFLDWSGSGELRKILYIDGEMGKRLLKMRVGESVKRMGVSPDDMIIICTEDFPDMKPLNTEAGQKWVDGLIKAYGGFNAIVFDNLQALTTGNLRETDVWEAVKPWAQSLSRRSIGQIWIDHTGLDETHAYGDSTKQWGLETSILLGKLDKMPPGVDVGFKLAFPKARNRAPWNRKDFRPIDIKLVGEKWESTGSAKPVELSINQQAALDLLPDDRSFATWLAACADSTRVTIATDAKVKISSARNIIRKLIEKGLVVIDGDKISLPKDEADQPFDE